MAKRTPKEWHISEHIKTDEDVHALLAAEREPYEKALRTAVDALHEVCFWLDVKFDPEDTVKLNDMISFIDLKLRTINQGLAAEGITIED